MFLRNIATIYLKEMIETIRDRRTLVFMVLMPTVLMPLILKVTTDFMSKAEKKAATESIKYALFGAEQVPGLAEALAEAPGFERVALDSLDQVRDAIRGESISLAVSVPADAARKAAEGEQITLEVYYDNALLVSKVKRRASAVVDAFGEKQRNARLTELGVNGSIAREQLLEPFTVRDRGIAEPREVVGAAVGGMLPYMLIIFCFLGCLYPAIDLGAGEKERGTLETLLLVPVPRAHLVIGKFAVIFSCGVISSVLSISSMGIWLFSKVDELPADVRGVLQTIHVTDFLLVGSMLIPVAAMFAALLLSISIFARSFKEAQAYATPLNVVIIIPAMLAMLPSVQLDWTWALMPITNIALAVKEIVKGTMDPVMYLVILASSTVIAGSLLTFCTKWFNREAVLFRE